MSRLEKLAMAAIFLIPFAWVNAQISDSVSQYQLDAAFVCEFTAAECRGQWPNRIITSSTDEA